ncbi:hypothetical protein [Shewanella chilikensis]|uniref:hypothetical protein n=1 Tax=Shewanella chilikensis TaxID=558541 RepID=UPI003999B54E
MDREIPTMEKYVIIQWDKFSKVIRNLQSNIEFRGSIDDKETDFKVGDIVGCIISANHPAPLNNVQVWPVGEGAKDKPILIMNGIERTAF